METKIEIATLLGHLDQVTSVAFNNIGTILASGSLDNTIKLWSIGTKTEIANLQGHESEVTSVAINNIGTILASGSFDKTIKL